MSLWSRVRSSLRAVFRGERTYREVAQEMSFTFRLAPRI